jgi:DNA (cytosine-5)-methyltransferase 1
MNKPKCIDAFSGSGGLSLGLIAAGFETLYAFDNDPVCIATQNTNKKYFKHLSEVADILNAPEKRINEAIKLGPGELDLVAGGPPCQGFSIQRIGADEDIRNQLVIGYLRLIRALKPKVFMMENVSGITGRRGRSILSSFLDQAEAAGYKITSKLLDAQDFGVAQRRKRFFVIGVDVKFKKEFQFPEPTTPKGNRKSVRSVIGDLPEPPADGTEHPKYPHHRRDRLSPVNLERIRHLKEGQSRIHLPEKLLPNCHRISAEKIGHRNVYGRMSWDDVAPTITARFDSFTRGMFGHPEQDRSITLLEGALLQGFPSDMRFEGSKVEVARQIGNAVPVDLATALGNSIHDYLAQLNS